MAVSPLSPLEKLLVRLSDKPDIVRLAEEFNQLVEEIGALDPHSDTEIIIVMLVAMTRCVPPLPPVTELLK